MVLFTINHTFLVWTAVRTAAKLLKCRKENLMDCLCTRKIRAGNEKIVQKLTSSQVDDGICYCCGVHSAISV